MKIFSYVFPILLSPLLLLGQDKSIPSKKNERAEIFNGLGLMLDYQYLKYQSVSIAFGFNEQSEHSSILGKGLMIRNEFVFKNGQNKLVYSPQISAFIYPAICFIGSNLSYYTDFDQGRFVIAPEFGLGLSPLFISYRRNFDLTRNDLIQINENNLSIKLILPIYHRN